MPKNTPKKHGGRISGFAALNSGEIDNCYSVVKIVRSNNTVGGFAGENVGEISNSFYNNGIRGLNGGLFATGKKNAKSSYFFHNEKNDKNNHCKKVERLHDSDFGIHFEQLKNRDDVEKLGFDTENIWQYAGAPQIMRFIPENWVFNIKDSPSYSRYIKEFAEVVTEEAPGDSSNSQGGIALITREIASSTVMTRMSIPTATKINSRIISDVNEMLRLTKKWDDKSSVLIHLDLENISQNKPTNIETDVVRTTDSLLELEDKIKPDNCVFAPGFIHLDFARFQNELKLQAKIIDKKDDIAALFKEISEENNNIALSYISLDFENADSIPTDYDEKVKVKVIRNSAAINSVVKKIKKGSNHAIIHVSVDSTPTETLFGEQAGFVPVRTADELCEIAALINSGDKAMSSAYIRLENDLDLGGAEWFPIGHDAANPFTGLFDGGGHTIKNFTLKSKHTKAKGFFGYLKGEVYNLTVDCFIKGSAGASVGGIAAYCQKGIIGYCASIVDIRCKNSLNSNINCGGLVGSNSGSIFQSYCAGKIGVVIPPWWAALPLPLVLLLIYMLLPSITDNNNNLPIFPPPPVDPGIERTPNDRIRPRPAEMNFVSFEFEQQIKINTETGECLFNFKNPGDSNHDIVVQLQMTDSAAIRAMGSTGRLPTEQTVLNEHPDYDPATYRMILAESGAIPPGYSLENLTLDKQPNGSILTPGKHPAIVFLILYDIETHSRAMIETQLPVVVVVE